MGFLRTQDQLFKRRRQGTGLQVTFGEEKEKITEKIRNRRKRYRRAMEKEGEQIIIQEIEGNCNYGERTKRGNR